MSVQMNMIVVLEGLDGFRKHLGYGYPFRTPIIQVPGVIVRSIANRIDCDDLPKIVHRRFYFDSWMCEAPYIALYKEQP